MIEIVVTDPPLERLGQITALSKERVVSPKKKYNQPK